MKKRNSGREIQSNITDNKSAEIKSSHGMIQGYDGIAPADENLKAISGQEETFSGRKLLADTKKESPQSSRP